MDRPTDIGCELGIPRLSSDVPFEEAVALLRMHGVVVIENVLSGSALRALRTDAAPWFSCAPCGAGRFFGQGTRRFGGVLAKVRASQDLAIHPLVLPVIEALLKGGASGPHCDAIELNLTQGIGIGPGEPAQFLHRDDELWPIPHDYELMANAMWCLDDFTPENGATRVIPDSHRWPRTRQPEPGEAVQTTAAAGSVILYTGSVLHAGAANRSNAIRRGIVMSYRLGWLAGGERLLLSVPPRLAREMPERLQRLLGYQLHRPNLGWIEGHDPIEWLRGEVGSLAAFNDNLTPKHNAMMQAIIVDPANYAGYL